MNNLIAQSIIAELAEEYNTLTRLRAGLNTFYDFARADDAQAQAAQAAYYHAMHVVARQAGIKLRPNRETYTRPAQ
jgi:hypothetical protein